MTLEEIEALPEAAWEAMPIEERAAAMKIVLDSLVTEGLAYLGPDGRYRMRENVQCSPDGIFTSGKVN